MHPNYSSINSSSFHLATTNEDAKTTFYGGGAHGGAGAAYWPGHPPAMTTTTSSTPEFLHQRLASNTGGESYNHPQAMLSSHKQKQSSVSSYQLRFTGHDSMLMSTTNKTASTSLATSSSSRGFTIGPWEECNSIAFDASAYDPQSHVPDKDSKAWRIRAKRGFATHPRSIAERERRSKINFKLKKLQELIPTIDKQTSYAEMLDSAVEHVKCLQNQIQELNEGLKNCTCGCKLDKQLRP